MKFISCRQLLQGEAHFAPSDMDAEHGIFLEAEDKERLALARAPDTLLGWYALAEAYVGEADTPKTVTIAHTTAPLNSGHSNGLDTGLGVRLDLVVDGCGGRWIGRWAEPVATPQTTSETRLKLSDTDIARSVLSYFNHLFDLLRPQLPDPVEILLSVSMHDHWTGGHHAPEPLNLTFLGVDGELVAELTIAFDVTVQSAKGGRQRLMMDLPLPRAAAGSGGCDEVIVVPSFGWAWSALEMLLLRLSPSLRIGKLTFSPKMPE